VKLWCFKELEHPLPLQ